LASYKATISSLEMSLHHFYYLQFTHPPKAKATAYTLTKCRHCHTLIGPLFMVFLLSSPLSTEKSECC
jgi:hypothetical protein